MTAYRARFVAKPDFPYRCTMHDHDENGAPLTRDFFAPACGGSVYEDYRNPHQVCEGLGSLGNTLVWRPGCYATLTALVRRERQKSLRRNRRYWAADPYRSGRP